MMNFEEFCDQPSLKNENNIYKKFSYIIAVSKNEDYQTAMNYMLPYLSSKEESLQIAAIQGFDILSLRFYNIDAKVLSLLLKNLTINNNLKSEIINALESIAHLVLKFRKIIYLNFFSNSLDFYTNKKLNKYVDVKELASFNTVEEKKEFILSFCQHSSNYDEAFSVCLDFLQKNECEELNISAIQGLTYLIIRFEKMEFTLLMPYIKKFLKDFFCLEYGYIESLLVNIAYYIPVLKPQAIEMLKSIKSNYIEMYKLEELE